MSISETGAGIKYWASKHPIAKAYDYFYGDPARQQKQAAARSADGVRQAGANAYTQYDQRGQQALDQFFGPADQAMNRYRQNEPNQQRLYAIGYNNRHSNQSGTRALYNSQVRGSGPQYVRNYAATRGTAPTYSQDRVRQRAAAPSPFYARDQKTQFDQWGSGPTETQKRYQARNNTPYDTRVAQLAAQRQRESTQATPIDELVRDWRPEMGAQRTDAYAQKFSRGQTDSADVMKRMKEGSSPLAEFLRGYRPGDTQALGETYKRLSAEDTSPEEEFYQQQLTGQNPAYNMLKEDTLRDVRRGANARGAFVSGKSLELEDRSGARLAAEEFARRGDLASKAGSARRARLGQQLEGANALDQLVQEQYATKGGLAGQQQSDLADLAMGREQLGSDLAKSGDASTLQMRGLQLEGANSQENARRLRTEHADQLTQQEYENLAGFNQNLDNLAKGADSSSDSRMAGYQSYLQGLDREERERQEQLDREAESAGKEWRDNDASNLTSARYSSAEQSDWDKYLADLSKNADSVDQSIDQLGLQAAQGASGEQSGYNEGLVDREGRMASAKASLKQAYDMAAVGALTQSEIAALDTELAAAGIDAKTRQSLINDLTKGGELFAKAHGGGAA